MQSDTMIEQLEDRYAEFVPSRSVDGGKEDGHISLDAKEQDMLRGRQEESAIEVTHKTIDDCICFIDDLQRKHSEIKEQMDALLKLELRIREMQLGMCKCFPSEYDGDKLLLAFDFVSVFVKKSKHWSFRHIDRSKEDVYKEAYLYARDIWFHMTKSIDAHDFDIGKMQNGTVVFFSFTVSNVPGKFEVALPIGKYFGCNQVCGNSPMQIIILYAMATMEHVLHSIGRTYYIDDVSTLLKEFVETDGYKKYLPSPTLEQEIPQSVWDTIEKSRQEASKGMTTI